MMSSIENVAMHSVLSINDALCSTASFLAADSSSSLNPICTAEAMSTGDENNHIRACSASDPCARSSSTLEANYDAKRIKNLLLNQKHAHQIVKGSHSSKAGWWRAFGYPARLNGNNVWKKIPGFISCLKCMPTQIYSPCSGTKCFKEHADKCFPTSASSKSFSPIYEVSTGTQRILDQVEFCKSINLNESDVVKIKNLSVEWICGDLRPFSILDDRGLRNLVQECIRLGE